MKCSKCYKRNKKRKKLTDTGSAKYVHKSAKYRYDNKTMALANFPKCHRRISSSNMELTKYVRNAIVN